MNFNEMLLLFYSSENEIEMKGMLGGESFSAFPVSLASFQHSRLKVSQLLFAAIEVYDTFVFHPKSFPPSNLSLHVFIFQL